nr:helix-turn-helix domain-containing protein [Bacillus cereus]
MLDSEVQPRLIHKSYKLRIYPNKIQEVSIAKKLGCSRFCFQSLPYFVEQYAQRNRERINLSFLLCRAHFLII